MNRDLPLGRALWRFRRLNGMKQEHAAELLGVSQALISRWESGRHEPTPRHRGQIAAFLAAAASNDADVALKRLVSHSLLSMHLVCDATHRLLAASPSRLTAWGIEISEYAGCSLWRYASPDIILAEDGLSEKGWFDRPYQMLQFETGANGHAKICVRPSLMRWETIPLADGRTGRLTTTIEWRE